MANATDVPNRPGAAKIENVFHVGEEQNDITLFVLRIDIHSDVNITAHQCDIQIADYENILDKFQFGPGDAISFTIKEDGKSFERRYKIKKVHDFVNVENGRLYKLSCISELEYVSLHTKISKSYSGLSDQVAAEILSNFTREGANVWESSSSNVEFISNYWSPLQILSWLSKKSRSGLSPTSFMFYQDSFQFWNFTSLAHLRTLYGNPQTFRYYQNTRSDNGIPNTEAIRNTIQGLKYYDAFDIQTELKRGNIKNTAYTHDFTTKTFQIDQSSYWETYKENALNDNMLWKQEQMGFGKVTRDIKVSSSGNLQGDRLPDDEVDEDLGYSRGQQIEIQLYGNTTVDIGQILNIEIPSPEPHKKSGQKDQTWSGKYYVVSKHDAYDKSGHTMALRLAKDSFI